MSYLPVSWQKLAPSNPLPNWPFFHRKSHKSKSDKENKWTHHIELGDFSPEHVKVRAENGKVLIHAQYSDKDDEWEDVVERKRIIQIPENVDSENIHSFMRSDGVLVVEAPYKDEKKEENLMKIEDEMENALVSIDKANDLMKIDVGKYNPEEISVTCMNGILTAKGERRRKENGVEIKESFVRQVALPNPKDDLDVKCFKSKDGLLTICTGKAKEIDLAEKEEQSK